MRERFRLTVKPANPTTTRADPYNPGPVGVKGLYRICNQAFPVASYVAIVIKRLCPAIKNADSAICEDPQHFLLVLVNLPDRIGRQTERVIGVMFVVNKGPCFPIESIQAASPCADPELA